MYIRYDTRTKVWNNHWGSNSLSICDWSIKTRLITLHISKCQKWLSVYNLDMAQRQMCGELSHNRCTSWLQFLWMTSEYLLNRLYAIIFKTFKKIVKTFNIRLLLQSQNHIFKCVYVRLIVCVCSFKDDIPEDLPGWVKWFYPDFH